MSATEYKPEKLFTLEQANKMLPLVRRVVEDISRTYIRMVETFERRREILGEGEAAALLETDESIDLYHEIEKDRGAIEAYLHELQKLGVELKGPADGLVDFPSLRDGRIVYLCWKLGEDDVRFWHELDAGFRGRQAIQSDCGAGTACSHGRN